MVIDPTTAPDMNAHRATVSQSVADNSTFDTAYVVMNALATVVACYGLLGNSTAVVIGAMIIAMLLGPISGVGLALVNGDNGLLRKAALALAGGLCVVLVTAFAIGMIHSDIPVTQEMISRTAPNLLDLMIALGGGAAGAFAVSSPRLSVAFVGVAIATALVPPLATSAMLLARGDWNLAGGAFLLAFTNVVAIQFACSMVFLFTGYHQTSATPLTRSRAIVRNGVTAAIMLVLAVVLAGDLTSDVTKLRYTAAVTRILKRELVTSPGSSLGSVKISTSPDGTLVRAVIRGPAPFSASQVQHMQQQLPPSRGGLPTQLRIRYVQTSVMSANGPVFEAEPTDSVPEEANK